MTSRGEAAQKLEYAFTVYDADNSGTLDGQEVRAVISGMLDMLGMFAVVRCRL
jgi:Ca2+-binding EF-hand superfamily protein